jgi:endonuclease/exonuclease/phosphatase family metal-dependent hydrolase
MLDLKAVPVRAARASVVLATSAALACAAAGAAHSSVAFIPSPEAGRCMISSLPDPVLWSSFAGPGAATPRPWCDAVGPVVSVAAESSDAPLDELVVVTWNVHVGGGDLVRFVEDLRSGAVTGRPATTFVLLLQEAYRAGAEVPSPDSDRLVPRIDEAPPSGKREDIARVARRLGLHLFYAPSMPNGRSADAGSLAEDRGNAILSTLPLTELGALELPFEVQRRVAVSAVVGGITGDGRPFTLRLASGHLDTRSRWSRVLDSFGTGRGRQASALGAWLDSESVMLGADLNTWSLGFLEEALDVLYARFPQSVRVSEATYSAAGVLGRRLDHLLYRLPEGTVDVRRVPSRYGSDHNPLVGVVRLGRAAAVGAEPGALTSAASR